MLKIVLSFLIQHLEDVIETTDFNNDIIATKAFALPFDHELLPSFSNLLAAVITTSSCLTLLMGLFYGELLMHRQLRGVLSQHCLSFFI